VEKHGDWASGTRGTLSSGAFIPIGGISFARSSTGIGRRAPAVDNGDEIRDSLDPRSSSRVKLLASVALVNKPRDPTPYYTFNFFI